MKTPVPSRNASSPGRAVATRGGGRPPTIGLALGGGGARGLAHILVIEALEELGLVPSLITGTSIGAIYGAALASGLSAAEIRAHTEETLSQRLDLARQLIAARAEPISHILRWLPMPNALLSPALLLDRLLPSRMQTHFELLSIPLEIVTTDFYAQEAAVMTSGLLRPAIAASIALPALFQPVKFGDRLLMDGGLVNPLPFDLLHGRADLTIAIDVSGSMLADAHGKPPGAFEAAVASTQILQRSIVREKLKASQPDVYIDVDVDHFHVLEFHRFREILAAAAPSKEALKRSLDRILGARTLTPREVSSSTITKRPPASSDTEPSRKKKPRLTLPKALTGKRR